MNIIQVPISSANWSIKDSYKAGICFHWIVGNLYSAGSTFKNPNRKASAHFGVGDNEGEVHQYVPISKVAFHAGDSDPFWENGNFIGIEHSGGEILPDGTRRKPSQQCHQNSIDLCVDICRKQRWDKLILPYSNTQRNQDPTSLINELKNQRAGIAVRHLNIANTGTLCSGSLDVEYIVAEVNKRLDPDNQQIPAINVKNNNMDKQKLVDYINQSQVFDDATKSSLIGAVYGNDAEHLITWSGEEPRRQQALLNEQVKNLTEQLASQVPVKIQPTDEEIDKIISERGYKSDQEVKELIKRALEDAVGVDNNENPIVIAPPIINIPQSKAPWKSKKFLSLMAFLVSQLAYLNQLAPVVAVGLSPAINQPYDVSLGIVLAGVLLIDAVIVGIYQVIQGKQDISMSLKTVQAAWTELLSRMPKKKV